MRQAKNVVFANLSLFFRKLCVAFWYVVSFFFHFTQKMLNIGLSSCELLSSTLLVLLFYLFVCFFHFPVPIFSTCFPHISIVDCYLIYFCVYSRFVCTLFGLWLLPQQGPNHETITEDHMQNTPTENWVVSIKMVKELLSQ